MGSLAAPLEPDTRAWRDPPGGKLEAVVTSDSDGAAPDSRIVVLALHRVGRRRRRRALGEEAHNVLHHAEMGLSLVSRGGDNEVALEDLVSIRPLVDAVLAAGVLA